MVGGPTTKTPSGPDHTAGVRSADLGRLPAQFPDSLLSANQQVYQRAKPAREDDDERPDEPAVALVGLAGQDLDQHPYPESQRGKRQRTADRAHRQPEPAERARGDDRAERVMHYLEDTGRARSVKPTDRAGALPGQAGV